ncbi:hypothetical protein B7P43_G03353 [Cryptotermes secundus]|uniref:Uncharacterized protein n=1 Tax=Cryptotermes secundus TaxID=105785 RepID=A0A2J7QXZ8_9NEOP|nr:hypothetical protein B7P43_G03353 [Cryptotermes secundus]
MASKDHCRLCEKPFYGKQKSIRCGERDSRFHCKFLPNCVPEPSVSATTVQTTGKSAYKCDSCIKLTGDAANEHSLCKSNQKEAISAEMQCTPSCIRDKDSLSVQLETLRTNGVCTMEMVQSIVVMLSNLSSEVQQLRIDNEAMKMQVRELQQAPSHVRSTRREAATSAITTAKSYRDVVCAANGNPNVSKVAAPGFRSDRASVSKTRGGGVLTALSSRIRSCKRRYDLESCDSVDSALAALNALFKMPWNMQFPVAS